MESRLAHESSSVEITFPGINKKQPFSLII